MVDSSKVEAMSSQILELQAQAKETQQQFTSLHQLIADRDKALEDRLESGLCKIMEALKSNWKGKAPVTEEASTSCHITSQVDNMFTSPAGKETSPEIATSAVLYTRIQRAYSQKVLLPSFVQLVDIVSEKIKEDPINGHKMHTIMDVVRTQGLVSEEAYYAQQHGQEFPEEELPLCVITGYRKYDVRLPLFTTVLIQEMRTNGPVVGVFPICSSYSIDRPSTLYLAEGMAAINENDHTSMLAMAVILTDFAVIDGIPCWVGSSHYTRNRDDRGRCRIELDAVAMTYAPLIHPSCLPPPS